MTRHRRGHGAAASAELDAGWVRPHWLEGRLDPTADAAADPAERNWTTVGSLGSSARAIVDPRGLVAPGLDGWSLDWWIGADDRWHFPSREQGVRQRLVDNTPVVETAMRVPGGDAVQRVYGVPGQGEGFVVVEIENRSPVPFAVALAIRPYNPEGLAGVERIGLVDDAATVDGRPAVLFPKRPARMAGSTFEQGDVVETVTSGAAGERLPDPLRCQAGRATAAFIFPLAHTATLRVALPLKGELVPDAPSPLPTAADVARGWKAQANRGMRLELPPGRLADAVEANRGFLLLLHDGPGASRRRPLPDAAAMVAALDRYGFYREAAEVIASFPRRQQARLLPAEFENGQAETALERVEARLESATDTFTWPEAGRHARAAAEFLSLVRDVLVREAPDGEGLVLCSTLPDGWAGQPLEVHDAPTRFGNLSYAVRWHGERPALLWELEGHEGASPVRLTAPGLDPAWTTTEPRGEALLQANPSRAQESFS